MTKKEATQEIVANVLYMMGVQMIAVILTSMLRITIKLETANIFLWR